MSRPWACSFFLCEIEFLTYAMYARYKEYRNLLKGKTVCNLSQMRERYPKTGPERL